MKHGGKRILYVGGFQLPDKNAAAHRVLSVANILRSLGYEVVFLDVSEEMTDYELSPMHKEAGYETYSQKRAAGLKRWASYVLNPLHAEEVLDRYTDWAGVIAYNYPAAALHKLKKICGKRNLAIYADCTEWYEYGFALSVHRIAVMLDTFFRMRAVQKKLDGLIVISQYLQNYYEKYVPVTVLPPLVDKTDPKWNVTEKTSDDTVSLAYAGSPGTRKDKLDVIVHALENCGNSRIILHVAGIRADEYLKSYPRDEALISSLRAAGKLIFYGRLPHAEALEIVKHSDYTIFYRNISRMTMAGFPTKFVESISCGVPVITNRTSDLAQYVKDGKNGVLLDTGRFEEELTEFFGKLDKNAPAVRTVEKDLFDYRTYVSRMEDWLNC